MADDKATEPHWLNSAEQYAWRHYLRGSAQLMEKINKDMLADNDLTLNEYEVLVRLSEAPEHNLRMSLLAENLVHSRSRLTHTVSRLEVMGYVERESCADDKRGVNCILTDKGYKKLEKAAPSHVESVRRHIVDVLTPQEFSEWGRIWRKLVDDCECDDVNCTLVGLPHEAK